MTTAELDELCRRYMACELSVLEEKELEYVLTRTDARSERIDDVRALMGARIPPQSAKTLRPRRGYWRIVCGAAACLAVAVAAGVHFLSTSAPIDASGVLDGPYIAVYTNGERMSDREAQAEALKAMSRADSLMNYAAAVEQEQLRHAEAIINHTYNN